MSKSGITFEVRKDDSPESESGIESSALKSPEAQQALRLLQSRLLVTDQATGQQESLDIEQVETYDQGLDPRYAKAFDSKERKPGTLFVVKFRGTALVNIVVDPDKKSVVYVKEVSGGNSESRSLASNLKRLIGEDFIEKLDGMPLDCPEDTGIELAPKGPGSTIMNITARVRSKTGKSTSEHQIIATRG